MKRSAPDNDTASRPHLPEAFYENYRPVSFSDLPHWEDDDHRAALSCFAVSARRMEKRAYSTKALGIEGANLARAGQAALAMISASQDLSGLKARKFFETWFTPFTTIRPFAGFVTGYFEPEVDASPVKTAEFRYPAYRRPPDLVSVDPDDPPKGIPAGFAFARQKNGGFEIYPDRPAIETGALSGRGLELFWFKDKVDLYFIHIQGSARLRLPDGSMRRMAYAGKTGHPFTAVGKVMVDRGIMPLEQVTMQTIKAYLRDNPQTADELMWSNNSFIFFQEAPQANPDLGPVAAASVPLTPGRSLAIDHRLHTFGTPIFVETKEPLEGETRPFRRLMIGQDTGSAIVGPARGDLFIGSGFEAGEIAGKVRNDANFTVLVPRPGPME